MQRPIQAEGELICPCGCGVVLKTITEQTEEPKSHSFDIQILGTALKTDIPYHFNVDREIMRKENVLNYLKSIVKEFGIPEEFALETYNFLVKKNRGFYSENYKIPIKQLIKLLEKDDNYMYIHKLRAIKKKYENLVNC